MSLILFGNVDTIGRIKYDEPELAATELSRYAGKYVRVEVVWQRNTRSLAQNAMGWGHVYREAVAEAADWLILDATGAPVRPVFRSRNDVHNFAKANLLLAPTPTTRGMVPLMGSTTELTTSEYSEYIERLCALLAQKGVKIPPAGNSR